MITKMFSAIIITFLLISSTLGDDHLVKNYGEPIKLKKLTSFKALVKNPGKYKNKEVLIEGVVENVCQNKGCWMEIRQGKDKLRVEFKDYGFFVPYDSKGKKVRIQGKIERREVKAETYKHWMEEAGEPKFKIDAIKENQKVLIFTASGVEMEGGSEFTEEQLQKIQGSSKHEH